MDRGASAYRKERLFITRLTQPDRRRRKGSDRQEKPSSAQGAPKMLHGMAETECPGLEGEVDRAAMSSQDAGRIIRPGQPTLCLLPAHDQRNSFVDMVRIWTCRLPWWRARRRLRHGHEAPPPPFRRGGRSHIIRYRPDRRGIHVWSRYCLAQPIDLLARNRAFQVR